MSITLLELRTQAREMADMVDNDFIGDSELNNYINFAIAELYDLLINADNDYYLADPYTGTTVANQSDYALPSDFYKLKGIDVKINGQDWLKISKFNFNERNRFDDFGAWTLLGIANVRYRVMGSNVKFTPIPDASLEYRIWYVPTIAKLSSDSDTLDDINQYSDFVIINAAMKMLNKEESDVSALASERNRIIKRIQENAKDRDPSEAESITDIHTDNNDYWWYTSRG